MDDKRQLLRHTVATLAYRAARALEGAPESFATFEAAIRKLPVMLDCYLVAGDFDYFLKSGCATSPTSTSCMGTSSLPCRVSARPAPFSS